MSPELYSGVNYVSCPLNSMNGYCDGETKIIKDLINDIESVTGNSKADNAVFSTEMKHAVNDIIIGEKLSLCVCQHPTEWSKKTDDAIKKFDILTDPSKPYQLDPNEAKQIKDHIKNLYWWDQVFPKKDNPDPKKLWYFNPISFIEHLKKISGLGEEFKLLVATVYGEASMASETAWKAIAHVIMNRVKEKH